MRYVLLSTEEALESCQRRFKYFDSIGGQVGEHKATCNRGTRCSCTLSLGRGGVGWEWLWRERYGSFVAP